MVTWAAGPGRQFRTGSGRRLSSGSITPTAPRAVSISRSTPLVQGTQESSAITACAWGRVGRHLACVRQWLLPCHAAGLYVARREERGRDPVSTTVAGSQLYSKVTMLEGRSPGWLVTWQGNGTVAGQQDTVGIFQQRYGAGGMPIGQEIRVNTSTTGSQDNAVVAQFHGNGGVGWLCGGTRIQLIRASSNRFSTITAGESAARRKSARLSPAPRSECRQRNDAGERALGGDLVGPDRHRIRNPVRRLPAGVQPRRHEERQRNEGQWPLVAAARQSQRHRDSAPTTGW